MMENLYLARYATTGPRLANKIAEDLRIIVVIPSSAEEGLPIALRSLINCKAPSVKVEVLVVINHSEKADEGTRNKNLESLSKAQEVTYQCPAWLHVHFIKAFDLPVKNAGVGLARRIGMDEAVRRFEQLKNEQPDIHQQGIIVCYDADCICDPDYLEAIQQHFTNQQTPACSIYYEHPVAGSEHSPEIYRGIIQYEMYLRYYVDALRWAGYPYAWQTVGSAIAVRSNVYQKQGGMNLRKAGEDFYFLQKLFPLPGFNELNRTRVIPSPRISHRVPFGTGKVMSEWVVKQKDQLPAYSPRAFQDLQKVINNIEALYQKDNVGAILDSLPDPIQNYLQQRNISNEITRIKQNSSNFNSFQKQFFAWFGGLKVLQYFHFVREQYYPDEPVAKASQWLLQQLNVTTNSSNSSKVLLLKMRELDHNWNFKPEFIHD